MAPDVEPPRSQPGNYQRRVVSGIRPGGRLHLGNYFGSVHDCLTFQYEYVGGAFYFIADLHEMTNVPTAGVLREQTVSAAVDYLSLGLQPDMVSFYLQSDVPQVSELMWMLACATPSRWLEQASVPEHDDGLSSAALLMYPALMAADCLALRATDVPIGADQAPNLELVRQIARRWNAQFESDLLPVPEPKLSCYQALPGLDGRRMSKGADNSLPVFATEEEINDRVGAIMATDGPTPGGTLGIVLELLRAVTDEGALYLEFADASRRDAVDLAHAKSALVAAISDRFAEARQARRDWARRTGDVEDLLIEGGAQVRMEATETLELMRELVGVGLGAGT